MDQMSPKAIHFIGIGGVGMSGIARVAAEQGITITGSDLRESKYTQQLREAGIKISIGQDKKNIENPDVVVVSTAILDKNPEYIEAKRKNIPIWHRAKMLSELGKGKKTLAIAGTHGKTTTSSMVASTLDALGFDPTFLIGGIVRSYGSNAHSGDGQYYVVEADESDKSFTYLDPYSVLITNIEADHLDHYSDLDEIYNLFQDFISSVSDNGYCVVCGEDENLVNLAKNSGHNLLTYGFSKDFDTTLVNYHSDGIKSYFEIILPNGEQLNCSLKQNPGIHNALNAAGVLTLLWTLKCDMQLAALKLSEFAGVRRRFDFIGKVNDITIVDDYAHHPTEIAATIKAAQLLDFKHIHVLFQPHRYSRVTLFTEVLRDEFAKAFDGADYVTFMDVYSAGETPIPGVSGSTFLEPIREHFAYKNNLKYIPRRLEIIPFLKKSLKPGDLLITMGAGDVTSLGPELLAALNEI